ncbi:NADP-dependent isocitrate dehydrogenase [Nesterenkonia natronophila]|uniref:Isocitrate dehydrogenase [NADP] n=1 Tax=Nesterenkonia natronophila TaxID=2174932 RepID=A0A3A4F2P9_9MICC|nr:NADP-dependent isocitrate dehydrogenase [Nesterenkonia natronophila]RJN32001.1 NADP-dependent isocitrate dehydrogenase [Nesterenkonia natronophila]
MAKIIFTNTDEAPMLATFSLKPIVEAFASTAGVEIETRDISLAGRIIAQFPDYVGEDKAEPDALGELGQLAKTPEANIIKLPNISASTPQLKAAIAELQQAGYALPEYPEAPESDEENDVRARYDKVKGSAVNPVLREGNSDRRAPASIKQYVRSNPHRMGEWSTESKTAVATMGERDFADNEQSVIIESSDQLTIKHVAADGSTTTLKNGLDVQAGEVIDGTFMSAEALDAFLSEQVERAKEQDVLFSAHLKATMMKVSDPIIFGHVVRAFFPTIFEKFGDQLAEAGLSPNDGLASILSGAEKMGAVGEEIKAEYDKALENGPRMSMVNDRKGITNLHTPSDVIVDASMPAMIRNGGQLWGPSGETADTLAVIPDSSYAGVYQAVIDDCRTNGAFDPTTLGTVPNVGLMAQKAEEYGSHDKTFEIPADGTVQVLNSAGDVLIEHQVETGDIWRACQTKDAPIEDWVKLAVNRARETGWPAVFWLDENRAHDANLISKVKTYLADHDTDGLTLEIMDPVAATKYSVDRIRRGENTISVTGNVLRDYLTDLFPILELGTSAKMLSIVPLMAGGGLFETGAGGSAPKHVQQLTEENYLRWDSLGEFFAIVPSLQKYAEQADAPRAKVLAAALDRATATFLMENRSPGRSLGTIDNRGSHFYLAQYWAQELAEQNDDADLAALFQPVAEALVQKEEQILSELNEVQGNPADIGGYYRPDEKKAFRVMRPSATLNSIVDGLVG